MGSSPTKVILFFVLSHITSDIGLVPGSMHMSAYQRVLIDGFLENRNSKDSSITYKKITLIHKRASEDIQFLYCKAIYHSPCIIVCSFLLVTLGCRTRYSAVSQTRVRITRDFMWELTFRKHLRKFYLCDSVQHLLLCKNSRLNLAFWWPC